MHFSFYNKPFITLIVKKTCQLLLRISVNGSIVLKMVGFVFHQGEAAASEVHAHGADEGDKEGAGH